MNYYLGIDLGSTTTKAVLIGEDESIIGRGLTNTRCNYTVATEVARSEALHNARFTLLTKKAEKKLGREASASILSALSGWFRVEQQMHQFETLEQSCLGVSSEALRPAVEELLKALRVPAHEAFVKASGDQSRFFRDLAGSCYYVLAEQIAGTRRVPFDSLIAVYDKAILLVENQIISLEFGEIAMRAFKALAAHDQTAFSPQMSAAVLEAIQELNTEPFNIANMVGTGYGRQRLPFEKQQIRSEILCHGLGAHFMYPQTRTVLDIGGQDTKAIQIDGHGLVTSFQMNDRCAAGCGRYLGYIADELNLGLHELGPLSMQADRVCQICSTCTVFAGAELRDLLSLGEKRENILAGLHRAIILRAMSLLARSGGVENEFTFTGGVAKNQAVVSALTELVLENYGERTLNINPDSIYTGALGAALYAHRRIDLEETQLVNDSRN